jgi:hypothetical protein
MVRAVRARRRAMVGARCGVQVVRTPQRGIVVRYGMLCYAQGIMTESLKEVIGPPRYPNPPLRASPRSHRASIRTGRPDRLPPPTAGRGERLDQVALYHRVAWRGGMLAWHRGARPPLTRWWC